MGGIFRDTYMREPTEGSVASTRDAVAACHFELACFAIVADIHVAQDVHIVVPTVA